MKASTMSSRPVPKISTQIKKSKKQSKSNSVSPALTREERAEMALLNTMLPPPARLQDPLADPALLLNSTCSYIDALLSTIVAKVNQGSLPRELLNQLPATPRAPLTSRPKKTNRKLEKRR